MRPSGCIDSLSSPVWTYVDGYAASAATLLSVYGEKRFMSKRSFLLIHQLSGSLFGTHSQMMFQAEQNSRLTEIGKEVYRRKTLLSDQQIETLFRTDQWLPSQTCLRYGIVDGIVDGSRVENLERDSFPSSLLRRGGGTIPAATREEEVWNPALSLSSLEKRQKRKTREKDRRKKVGVGGKRVGVDRVLTPFPGKQAGDSSLIS